MKIRRAVGAGPRTPLSRLTAIDSNYKNAHAQLRDIMAFLKPAGSYLILSQNLTEKADSLELSVTGKTVPVTLPDHSDCAITLSAP